MAAISVTQKWSGLKSEQTRDGISFTDGYEVLLDGTDPILQAPIVARQAAGIPRVHDVHPFDPNLRVQRVAAKVRTMTFYDVLVTYSTPHEGSEANPLDEPAGIDWDFLDVVEPVEYDADGAPVTNTVGEPFDPPLTRQTDDAVLTIKRNVATFDPRIAIAYRNVTNSDFFFAVPGQALMRKLAAASVLQGNFEFWDQAAVIHFRRGLPLQQDGTGGPQKAWYRRILNQGFRTRVLDESGDPKSDENGAPLYTPIKGADGDPLAEPVLLTEEGQQLKDDEDPYWIESKWFPELPFGPLNLL